ncbi:hypothetical protein [Pseudogulbenkiania subflava]|nr:hypothetical protein [Pseudogulbenkiania subflava]
MSTLARLARKSSLTDADIERIAAAVAGHAPTPSEPPPAGPQSPRMRALMRQMHSPAPVSQRPSAPAATAHRNEAAVAPRPTMRPIPAGEIPVIVRNDNFGRMNAVQIGGQDFHITRDSNGFIKALVNADGAGVLITRRDANGNIAGLLATPPRWAC